MWNNYELKMNFPTIFEFGTLDNRYKQIGSVSVL